MGRFSERLFDIVAEAVLHPPARAGEMFKLKSAKPLAVELEVGALIKIGNSSGNVPTVTKEEPARGFEQLGLALTDYVPPDTEAASIAMESEQSRSKVSRNIVEPIVTETARQIIQSSLAQDVDALNIVDELKRYYVKVCRDPEQASSTDFAELMGESIEPATGSTFVESEALNAKIKKYTPAVQSYIRHTAMVQALEEVDKSHKALMTQKTAQAKRIERQESHVKQAQEAQKIVLAKESSAEVSVARGLANSYMALQSEATKARTAAKPATQEEIAGLQKEMDSITEAKRVALEKVLLDFGGLKIDIEQRQEKELGGLSTVERTNEDVMRQITDRYSKELAAAAEARDAKLQEIEVRAAADTTKREKQLAELKKPPEQKEREALSGLQTAVVSSNKVLQQFIGHEQSRSLVLVQALSGIDREKLTVTQQEQFDKLLMSVRTIHDFFEENIDLPQKLLSCKSLEELQKLLKIVDKLYQKSTQLDEFCKSLQPYTTIVLQGAQEELARDREILASLGEQTTFIERQLQSARSNMAEENKKFSKACSEDKTELGRDLNRLRVDLDDELKQIFRDYSGSSYAVKLLETPELTKLALRLQASISKLEESKKEGSLSQERTELLGRQIEQATRLLRRIVIPELHRRQTLGTDETPLETLRSGMRRKTEAHKIPQISLLAVAPKASATPKTSKDILSAQAKGAASSKGKPPSSLRPPQVLTESSHKPAGEYTLTPEEQQAYQNFQAKAKERERRETEAKTEERVAVAPAVPVAAGSVQLLVKEVTQTVASMHSETEMLVADTERAQMEVAWIESKATVAASSQAAQKFDESLRANCGQLVDAYYAEDLGVGAQVEAAASSTKVLGKTKEQCAADAARWIDNERTYAFVAGQLGGGSLRYLLYSVEQIVNAQANFYAMTQEWVTILFQNGMRCSLDGKVAATPEEMYKFLTKKTHSPIQFTEDASKKILGMLPVSAVEYVREMADAIGKCEGMGTVRAFFTDLVMATDYERKAKQVNSLHLLASAFDRAIAKKYEGAIARMNECVKRISQLESRRNEVYAQIRASVTVTDDAAATLVKHCDEAVKLVAEEKTALDRQSELMSLLGKGESKAAEELVSSVESGFKFVSKGAAQLQEEIIRTYKEFLTVFKQSFEAAAKNAAVAFEDYEQVSRSIERLSSAIKAGGGRNAQELRTDFERMTSLLEQQRKLAEIMGSTVPRAIEGFNNVLRLEASLKAVAHLAGSASEEECVGEINRLHAQVTEKKDRLSGLLAGAQRTKLGEDALQREISVVQTTIEALEKQKAESDALNQANQKALGELQRKITEMETASAGDKDELEKLKQLKAEVEARSKGDAAKHEERKGGLEQEIGELRAKLEASERAKAELEVKAAQAEEAKAEAERAGKERTQGVISDEQRQINELRQRGKVNIETIALLVKDVEQLQSMQINVTRSTMLLSERSDEELMGMCRELAIVKAMTIFYNEGNAYVQGKLQGVASEEWPQKRKEFWEEFLNTKATEEKVTEALHAVKVTLKGESTDFDTVSKALAEAQKEYATLFVEAKPQEGAEAAAVVVQEEAVKADKSSALDVLGKYRTSLEHTDREITQGEYQAREGEYQQKKAAGERVVPSLGATVRSVAKAGEDGKFKLRDHYFEIKDRAQSSFVDFGEAGADINFEALKISLRALSGKYTREKAGLAAKPRTETKQAILEGRIKAIEEILRLIDELKERQDQLKALLEKGHGVTKDEIELKARLQNEIAGKQKDITRRLKLLEEGVTRDKKDLEDENHDLESEITVREATLAGGETCETLLGKIRLAQTIFDTRSKKWQEAAKLIEEARKVIADEAVPVEPGRQPSSVSEELKELVQAQKARKAQLEQKRAEINAAKQKLEAERGKRESLYGEYERLSEEIGAEIGRHGEIVAEVTAVDQVAEQVNALKMHIGNATEEYPEAEGFLFECIMILRDCRMDNRRVNFNKPYMSQTIVAALQLCADLKDAESKLRKFPDGKHSWSELSEGEQKRLSPDEREQCELREAIKDKRLRILQTVHEYVLYGKEEGKGNSPYAKNVLVEVASSRLSPKLMANAGFFVRWRNSRQIKGDKSKYMGVFQEKTKATLEYFRDQSHREALATIETTEALTKLEEQNATLRRAELTTASFRKLVPAVASVSRGLEGAAAILPVVAGTFDSFAQLHEARAKRYKATASDKFAAMKMMADQVVHWGMKAYNTRQVALYGQQSWGAARSFGGSIASLGAAATVAAATGGAATFAVVGPALSTIKSGAVLAQSLGMMAFYGHKLTATSPYTLYKRMKESYRAKYEVTSSAAELLEQASGLVGNMQSEFMRNVDAYDVLRAKVEAQELRHESLVKAYKRLPTEENKMALEQSSRDRETLQIVFRMTSDKIISCYSTGGSNTKLCEVLIARLKAMQKEANDVARAFQGFLEGEENTKEAEEQRGMLMRFVRGIGGVSKVSKDIGPLIETLEAFVIATKKVAEIIVREQARSGIPDSVAQLSRETAKVLEEKMSDTETRVIDAMAEAAQKPQAAGAVAFHSGHPQCAKVRLFGIRYQAQMQAASTFVAFAGEGAIVPDVSFTERVRSLEAQAKQAQGDKKTKLTSYANTIKAANTLLIDGRCVEKIPENMGNWVTEVEGFMGIIKDVLEHPATNKYDPRDKQRKGATFREKSVIAVMKELSKHYAHGDVFKTYFNDKVICGLVTLWMPMLERMVDVIERMVSDADDRQTKKQLQEVAEYFKTVISFCTTCRSCLNADAKEWAKDLLGEEPQRLLKEMFDDKTVTGAIDQARQKLQLGDQARVEAPPLVPPAPAVVLPPQPQPVKASGWTATLLKALGGSGEKQEWMRVNVEEYRVVSTVDRRVRLEEARELAKEGAQRAAGIGAQDYAGLVKEFEKIDQEKQQWQEKNIKLYNDSQDKGGFFENVKKLTNAFEEGREAGYTEVDYSDLLKKLEELRAAEALKPAERLVEAPKPAEVPKPAPKPEEQKPAEVPKPAQRLAEEAPQPVEAPKPEGDGTPQP